MQLPMVVNILMVMITSQKDALATSPFMILKNIIKKTG
jgi:hypothetical protein